MQEKSAEFRERGGEVYLRTDAGDAAEAEAESEAEAEETVAVD